ncbi:ATP-binding cassette domain-containing protein [Pokkaliibacter sp. MBI-7]|uniref:ATP-binding cassette domain-containing protein n=1 Tax=Pokkaliibacter sp. MBI-7 TaxID=3040600 RepID=UPI002446D48A|nr:ATP-binding cassette domain-containing protein [Pokkaliibacter sp. MBI-7]MDH2433466.1 ATP-binding cassette domain-containing protein [Pokkaliibacter sp. MBI-7]
MDYKDNIFFSKIETNNLKKVSVSVPVQSIFAITGVSGGGKSSLAYGTIYEICRQEFQTIESGYIEETNYKVEDFGNIKPAVAIKQCNENINPSSSIYTYLNFSSLLASYTGNSEMNIPPHLLKINKPSLCCDACHGLGVIYEPDGNKIVKFDKSIRDGSFVPWVNRFHSIYNNLLMDFCGRKNIDTTIRLDKISKESQYLLLHGEDDIEFKIGYKHGNKRRYKTLTYTGIFKFIENLSKSNIKSDYELFKKYSSKIQCRKCLGSGLSNSFEGLFIGNICFSDFLTKPVNEILFNKNFISSHLYKIVNILKEIHDIGLGYLSLKRSIPTLSGGELQKLNFARACTSKITGIIYILDEISSQVHCSDYNIFLRKIIDLKNKRNTLILVEHNPYFLINADEVITIGPEPGAKGGYLLSNDDFYESFSLNKAVFFKEKFSVHIKSFNNISDLTFNFPEKSITALVGKSGSGKSSIAKYIYNYFDEVTYISQVSVKGNITSSVASYTGANSLFAKIFAKAFNKNEKFFMPNENSEIVCDVCYGRGEIKYNRSFESDITILCPKCDGKIFSEFSDLYRIKGYSLIEIYDAPIEEINLYFPSQIFESVINVGLGHLSINRKIKTLSGGELKRIKLASNIPAKKITNRILIVDEPTSGLDNKTALAVVDFISQYKDRYKFIIVIDHKPVAFMSADYLYEIGPGSGDEGGDIVYEGSPNYYYENKYLPFLKG